MRQTPFFRAPATAATVALAAGLVLGGCNALPRSPGETLLRARCSGCHHFDNALNKRKSARGWERTVWAMRQRGAELSDEEAHRLVLYLSRERAP